MYRKLITLALFANSLFSNIVNNPIWQSVSINPINSGLLRIDAKSMNAGERAVYEDIEIITE